MFREYMEEGGLAESVGLVDIDNEWAIVGLWGVEGGEYFLDKDLGGCIAVKFVIGSGLIRLEGYWWYVGFNKFGGFNGIMFAENLNCDDEDETDEK